MRLSRVVWVVVILVSSQAAAESEDLSAVPAYAEPPAAEPVVAAPADPPAVPPADAEPPVIEHRQCEYFAPGTPFVLQARITDASRIYLPRALYRAQGEREWQAAPFEIDAATGIFSATLPPPAAPDAMLEYLIEAFDELGNGPARQGSEDLPLMLQPSVKPPPCSQVNNELQSLLPASQQPVGQTPAIVATPPPPREGCEADDPPLYCSAGLWTLLGAVVLTSAGLGAYIALSHDPEPRAPPKYISIEVRGPAPVQQPLRGSR